MASLGLKISDHVLCSLTCKPGYGDAHIRSDRTTRKLRKRKVEDLANHKHQVQRSLKRLKNALGRVILRLLPTKGEEVTMPVSTQTANLSCDPRLHIKLEEK